MSDFYMDTVVIFAATGFRNAFERALTLGKTDEEEYETGEGKDLRWRLEKVSALDFIAETADELDGAEVYYELVDVDNEVSYKFDSKLHPEAHVPWQTVTPPDVEIDL